MSEHPCDRFECGERGCYAASVDMPMYCAAGRRVPEPPPLESPAAPVELGAFAEYAAARRQRADDEDEAELRADPAERDEPDWLP